MADALLSGFLNQLTSAITKMAAHEVMLFKGVDDAIEDLKKHLLAIKVVLKDAEKKQFDNDAVKMWIDELKDVSYDIDQILDEWSTAILQADIVKEEGRAGENASLHSKLKVHLSALCHCARSGPLGRVVHRRDVASKIEGLNSRLVGISTRKEMFNFSLTNARVDNPIQPYPTSSINESKVFGQDAYKKNLMDQLLAKDGQNRGNLQIIPVVGMGGIGKTTLAKLVFNDDDVKRHFGKIIWVCVSDPFDIVKIANAIIQQLTGEAPPTVELQVLMKSLDTSIKKEKFLLVLDDVWTNDYLKWEPLGKVLSCGPVGSKVIVTTRNVEVGRMMGIRDTSMVFLEELSENDCWLLFSEIAYFGKTEEEKKELEEIGRKITVKCDGLPLAAKTLGSLLRIKTNKQEWLHVLESDLWKLTSVKEGLFRPLLLSYFDLSPTEKRCFTYCASFIKDEELGKKNLIRMWMAQGYFDGFTIGEICFDNLVRRSFFQDFEIIWDGDIVSCKMHDIVHDFSQFLTMDDHCTISKFQEKIELSTRHLTLIVPPDHQSQKSPIVSISCKKKLVSLNLLSSKIVGENLINWCLSFKSLRFFTLEVKDKIKDIPESIGDLVHLRYLRLSCKNEKDEIRELPCSLGNLCNLQSLIFAGFTLPKEVSKLTNLTCLRCDTLGYFPKGVSRLKILEHLTLELCPSTNVNTKEKFELGDLSNLNHLRFLKLKNVGIDEGHVEGAKQAQLLQKTNLSWLALFFAERDGTRAIDYETLEALQHPPKLTILGIDNYGASVIAPSWMSSSSTLTHLRALHLSGFPKCETLPHLGKLQSLESLVIDEMKMVKKVGPEFLGVLEGEEAEYEISASELTLFPKLKWLQFRFMSSWSEWVGIQGWNKDSYTITIMPCLEMLWLDECAELEALPEFLEKTPLKELIIEDSPKLKSACESEIGKEWGKIKHVPNIKFL